MPVKTFRPLMPSLRYITVADFSDITKTKPEKSLVEIRKKTGGRNMYGRVTARGISGGHKQKIRIVDFKRAKHGVEATVAAIAEYDPMRSARLALLQYKGRGKALYHRSGRHQGWCRCFPVARRLLRKSAIVLSAQIYPGQLEAIHNLELTPRSWWPDGSFRWRCKRL